jgi:site-specific recombinase XerD
MPNLPKNLRKSLPFLINSLTDFKKCVILLPISTILGDNMREENNTNKRKGRRLPIILSEEEVEKLLKVPNKRCFTGLRNLTIMKVILYCGLRSEEIVNLKLQDVNLNTGHTTVHNGKGFKDRCVYIKNDALVQLKKWIEFKEKHKSEKFRNSEYVFPTAEGKKLDTRCLRFTFRRYGNKAGIKKFVTTINKEGEKVERIRSVSPHILRATMASNYYRATKDIRGLQLILGHESLATTQLYMYVYNEDIAENLEHFPDKKKREKEVIEKIKELEEEIKKLKNGIDQNKLFDY